MTDQVIHAKIVKIINFLFKIHVNIYFINKLYDFSSTPICMFWLTVERV